MRRIRTTAKKDVEQPLVILGATLLVGALVAVWIAASSIASATSAEAGDQTKLAFFPIDLAIQTKPEDFFFGPKGPNEDEQRRLDAAYEELTKRIVADGRYALVDISSLDEEMKQKRPLFECNGCEVDLAAKVGAEHVMVASVDKISETSLRFNVTVLTVPESKFVSTQSVIIQGNTDEAWAHGVRWIAKNRLFAKGDK